MKFNESKLLLMMSGIFTGIVITSFLVKSTPTKTMFLTYRDYQRLKHENFTLNREVAALSKNLVELQVKYNQYTTSEKRTKTILESLKKEYEEAKMLSGMEQVKGPGIEVKVDDARRSTYLNDFELWNSIVHDFDLRQLIVDLKNANAEAIEVNGYRVVANTSITCEGPIIMINGNYITPPFTIKAIGDKDALYYAMYNPDSWYKTMELRGLKLNLIKQDEITIKGVNEDIEPKYLKIKR
ncbi:MAG: hypothetical protein JG776_1561 [Caloramator sp.]|jgi:uncharacterized protein YlxW (UPF0749 family)|uniref:DUF881 domain-containing protein n=1 Tax=Caloramator sp. TaxID=1871330 RepID=UPI001DF518C3|nr:DUF881 domain-containing protein [Caloramator sp.]MBZ4663846.1 hypothetical protein [Caloramator sp.]